MSHTLKVFFAVGGLIAAMMASAQGPRSAGAANAIRPAASAGPVEPGIPGAAGNGTTDDSAALASHFAMLPANGAIVHLGAGSTYRIARNLTIPANVTLDCQQSPGTMAANDGYRLHSLGGIRLDPTATIMLSAGSRIQHCVILQNGIVFPVQTPAAYAGTAITYGSGGGNVADTWLYDNLIVGFDLCVDQSGQQADRLHWINLECDGVSGYKIGTSYDTAIISHVRAWPWGTAFFTSAPPITKRAGTGFLVTSAVPMSDILDYGHGTGLDIEVGGAVFGGLVWLDTNTISLKINGRNISPNDDTYIGSLYVVGTGYGASDRIQFNNAGHVHINHLEQWMDASVANCIDLTGTQLTIDYAHMVGCRTSGFNVTDRASRIRVSSGLASNIGMPVVRLPPGNATAGMPGDAIQVDIAALPNGALYANGSLLPQFAWGDAVSATGNLTAPQAVITGSGQAAPQLTETGSMGGALMLDDSGAGAGHGGALVFGSSNVLHRFAAIKGSIVSAQNNSSGDLDVALRRAATDPALTQVFHFDHTGYIQPTKASSAADTGGCNAAAIGAMQVVTDSNTAIWGARIAGGGTNVVLGFCDGKNWTVMAK